MGGVSYSSSVAYLARYRISALKDVIKYFTTFFASKFFSPIFLLWNLGASYGPKNMVYNMEFVSLYILVRNIYILLTQGEHYITITLKGSKWVSENVEDKCFNKHLFNVFVLKLLFEWAL